MSETPRRRRAGRGHLPAALLCGALAALTLGQVATAAPARALDVSDVQRATMVATDRGFRTGVAVLDLATGEYSGSGEDTGRFPSESVAKVLIATQLLLSGQMSGATEAMARQMITASDDRAANALYTRAGGDDVVERVAAHYGIADLGGPPTRPGWWGMTQISPRGLVELYAALARDPAVGPWLTGAMAHASTFGADGTYQLFGLPAATTDPAIKQGWGHDGAAGDAVANSTGYTDGGRFAVAILTEGPAAAYGTAIADLVTAQARALMPEGRLGPAPVPAPDDAPAAATPAPPAPRNDLVVHVRAWLERSWPELLGGLGLAGAVGSGSWGAHRWRTRIRRRREERAEARRRRRRAHALQAVTRGQAAVVRLRSGRLALVPAPAAASRRPPARAA